MKESKKKETLQEKLAKRKYHIPNRFIWWLYYVIMVKFMLRKYRPKVTIKDDINDCMIGGYEEMGLEKKTGGITVHYSEIFDGANHVQARFISDGDLYVIDITSKDAIDLDSFLEKILK